MASAKQKTNKLKIVSRALLVIIGGIITAYGLESVLIPNRVSDGGVTGLSIVGSQLFGLPLGLLIALLNIPFVYLGYKQIGKSFAIYSVIGIATLAVSTSLMHHIPTIIQGDTLLVTVVGGIIIGFGMGLALRNGGALDGIDMLAVLLSRKSPFGTSDLILFLNMFVFIVVSTVFGLQGAFLSAIAYFIASKVIPIVEEGLSGLKSFKIITTEPELMVETIRDRLGRGATYSLALGGYSNEQFKEITCIINRLEESKMKEIIQEIDPRAFVAIYDVTEVKGGNFKKHDIH
ncbi:YitT family protein [Schinkia azotoformans]|uniref:YitT family protein n=1 Tax=Schinkia azotoformans TaxID=1454 RepID=UPI002DBB0960|nr:YitT family protein [Schinkia azotoformans]MEC1717095.1 YitT family protein [Schinkia azotoformans]MEC1741909.1 YitT family protein [Schinkia azotoformans]MEC1747277.1 YitT family protein [Schinkia azotoformans]MEC1758151.1 YitT family protein [Schinkia azotoformans]MEC1766449.1 YitT family protein [Schinkia azotoformans]